MEGYSRLSETIRPSIRGAEMIFKKEPFWKVPLCFAADFKCPCPFIWLGWWVITWNPDNLREIDISFQPD